MPKRIYAILLVVLLTLTACPSKDVVIPQFPEPKETVLPIQRKYGTILNIEPKKIEPIALFEFIDEWINTPYKMGGETKEGIDCSFFTQYLYHDVYKNLIERTAQKQFDAPDTDKFLGQEFIEQGDLLFFNPSGSDKRRITHVGVYLGNDRFVHSTSRKGESGKNGVQISNFQDKHWQKMFVAAAKKPKNVTTEELNGETDQ
ncbi:NlpC/P60 family protein [Gangjinia marincola]|uniref:NlpC/P60 family protein n=1 Tax=Gangjinia marincola TaxID=578463 RepID=A0ABN1MJN4_9FLAO